MGQQPGNSYFQKVMEQMNIRIGDTLELETTGDAITLRKKFRHRTFEERLAEYDGKISVYVFDWGEPEGRELL